MNLRNEGCIKTILFGLSLATILFSGCQSAPQDARVSTQESKANDQTAAIRVSTLGADAAEPALAADSGGNLYVLYVEHGADKSADLFLQKFAIDQKPIGEKTRVNPEKGRVKAWFGDPPTIVVGADGAVYVGWTATVKSAEKPNANVLYLSVSRDGGRSFNAPVRINDDLAPAAHGMHSLAVGRDGSIYAAWLDERNVKTAHHAENFEAQMPKGADPEFRFIKAHHNSNQNQSAEHDKSETDKTEKLVEKAHESAEPNSEVFFASSSDGGRTFSPNRKLASDVCPCCKTAVLAAPDGRLYVSWRQVLEGDYRHIAVTSSADQGANFAAPRVVSDDRWQINACPVSGAALAAGTDGVLEVVWYTAGAAGAPGLYRTKSTDGGKTFAPRVLVSEGAVSGTPTMFFGGGAGQHLVWTADGKSFSKTVSASRAGARDRRRRISGDGRRQKPNFYELRDKNRRGARGLAIRRQNRLNAIKNSAPNRKILFTIFRLNITIFSDNS